MAKRCFDDLKEVDIDPDSSLAIYLWLKDCPMWESPVTSPIDENIDPCLQDRTQARTHGRRSERPFTGALTLEKVLGMPMHKLELLQDKVTQMEKSNNGLLTNIYGTFPSDKQPFPMIMTSRHTSPDFPERGSYQHRQLVFSQFKNMMAIARDPTRCMDRIEPSTTRGARALQEYQMQLLLLEQHKRTEMLSQHVQSPTSPTKPTSPSNWKDGFHVLDLGTKENIRRPDSHTSHALTDYQMQLVLLEEQNRKRLMQARKSQERSASVGGRPTEDDYQYVPVEPSQSKPKQRKSRTLPSKTHQTRSRQ